MSVPSVNCNQWGPQYQVEIQAWHNLLMRGKQKPPTRAQKASGSRFTELTQRVPSLFKVLFSFGVCQSRYLLSKVQTTILSKVC